MVRVYEGEVVVKGMDAYATVASFLTGGPTAIEPCSRLRRAYRRDLTVRKRPSNPRSSGRFRVLGISWSTTRRRRAS